MADKKTPPSLAAASSSLVPLTDFSNPYVTTKVPKVTSPSSSASQPLLDHQSRFSAQISENPNPKSDFDYPDAKKQSQNQITSQSTNQLLPLSSQPALLNTPTPISGRTTTVASKPQPAVSAHDPKIPAVTSQLQDQKSSDLKYISNGDSTVSKATDAYMQPNNSGAGNNTLDQGQVDENNGSKDENATDESNKSIEIRETPGKRKSSQGSASMAKTANSGGQQPQVIKRSNIKAAAMVNNYFAPNQPSQQQPMHNPVVSQVMKQQGWDKIKNLKSVLDNRKSGKGTSGTRLSAKQSKRGADTPPQQQQSAQNRQVYNQGKKGAKKQNGGQVAQLHHASFDNSNLQTRKSSQDFQNAGKRPPSQTSKNSGKAPSSGNRAHRMASSHHQTPVPFLKARESPLMLVEKGTPGSNGAASKSRKKQTQENFLVPDPKQVAGRKSDIEKGRDSLGTIEQPDNEYLETMKQRIRGLPDLNKNQNSSGSLHQQLPKKASYEQLGAMDTQEIIDRANQLISEQDRDPSHIDNKPIMDQQFQKKTGEQVYNQGVASATSGENNQIKQGEDILLRSPFDSIDLHATGEFPNESPVFEMKKASQDPDSQARDELIEVDKSIQMIDQIFGQASQKGLSGNTFRRPKFLQNKLSSLMRDTKSSAQRNRYRVQPSNNNVQTPNLGAPSPGYQADEAHVQKKSPLKGVSKLQSPKKRQLSPFQKFKYSTRSSQNLQTIISLKEVSPGKFERIKQNSSIKNEQPFEYSAQQNANKQAYLQTKHYNDSTDTINIAALATPQISEIPPTDSPTQITLEGISGMVLVDPSSTSSLKHPATSFDDEDPKDCQPDTLLGGMPNTSDQQMNVIYDLNESNRGFEFNEEAVERGQSGQLSSSSPGSQLQGSNSQVQQQFANHSGSPIKKKLDLEQIKIDQKDLHDISKSSREMQNIRNTKNNEFNAELKNIIGSINSRTKVLKATFSMNTTQNSAQQHLEGRIQDTVGRTSLIEPGMEQTQNLKQFDNLNRQTMGSSYTQRSNRADTIRTAEADKMAMTDDRISGTAAVDDEDDPLKAVALEFSSEANDLDAGSSVDKNEHKKILTLDQTIVVTEDLDDTNNFDDLEIIKSATDTQQDKGSELNRRTSQFTDLEIERLKDKNDDKKCIQLSIDDLQDLVNNMKVRHRAEIDAILNEQGVYKRIIQELMIKLTKSQQLINSQDIQILGLQKYERQAIKFAELNTKLQSEIEFYRAQTDRLKVAIIEYDVHVRESVVVANEFHISQLETENAHLRKLLNIPHELFVKDAAEEKKRENEKKKNVLKSIDEKLKAAEKKIARKQSAQEVYNQQQKQHGLDQFALEQEDYDKFRLSRLKDHQDMPDKMKKQLQGKIHTKIEERQYRDEVRRRQEKEILQEFARVYGYDVNKHQPEPNDGEIDVEYLQAYIAECRQKEDQVTEQFNSAMQETENADSSEIQQQESFAEDDSQNWETQFEAPTSSNSVTDSMQHSEEQQLAEKTDCNSNSADAPSEKQQNESEASLATEDPHENQQQLSNQIEKTTKYTQLSHSDKKPESAAVQSPPKDTASSPKSQTSDQITQNQEKDNENNSILQLQVPKEGNKGERERSGSPKNDKERNKERSGSPKNSKVGKEGC